MCVPDPSLEGSPSPSAEGASPFKAQAPVSTERASLSAWPAEELLRHQGQSSAPDPCSPSANPSRTGATHAEAHPGPGTNSSGPREADSRSWGSAQCPFVENGGTLDVEARQGPPVSPLASTRSLSGASASVSGGSGTSFASNIAPGQHVAAISQSHDLASRESFANASGSEAAGHRDAIGYSDGTCTPRSCSDASTSGGDVSSGGSNDASSSAPVSVGVPRFVEVVVEVPRGSFVKWRAEDIRHGQPTRWTVDYVGFLPCPFNYGSVPAFEALDGDPQDALVLGPRIPRGRTASIRVEALLKFVDAGRDHSPASS